MKSHVTDQPPPGLEEVATTWFVRLRDTAATEADQLAFDAWRQECPAHEQAYRSVERVWGGLGQLAEESRAKATDATPPMEEAAVLSFEPLTRRPKPVSYRPLARLALVASVLIALAIGGYVEFGTRLLSDHYADTGQVRTVALSDGSEVSLNTETAVSISFDGSTRAVTLHQGEAYFQVTSDPDRPFVVTTDLGSVRVLGTAFAVRQVEGDVRVVVTENAVEVDDQAGGSVKVPEGRAVDIQQAGLGPVERSNPRAELAWRKGRLVFENQPLAEVLDELERYQPGEIILLDQSLGALPVTGSFKIAEADRILETFARTLPIRVTELGGLIALVQAD